MNAKRLMLCVVLVLAGSTARADPPWYGTIFIAPDTITESDPTTFSGMTYAGQGWRTLYDRRVPGYVTVYAYLFDTIFSDGLGAEIRINPEFGSVANAQIEAEKYSTAIGRLPNALRRDVAHVAIHKGVEKFGGGGGGILIHTGYAEDHYIPDGILEETLAHEAAHTSLDADHRNSPGWLAAQTADPEFISEYARDNPTREDIAESFVPYMAIRYRPDRIPSSIYDTITSTIPNRIAYFDAQGFNMHPLTLTVTTLATTTSTTTGGSSTTAVASTTTTTTCSGPAVYVWVGPTSGAAAWNLDANWQRVSGCSLTPDYPNGLDETADLTMDVDGALTITLTAPVTIGTLIDGDTDAVAGPNPIVLTGDTLTFDVSAGNARWTHSPAGDATFDIAAPVLLDDSIEIYNDRGAYNGRMLIGGNVTAASAGLKEILYMGLTNPAGGGQPYIRIGGIVSDGPGQLAVTMQSTSTSSGPGLYLDNAGNSYSGPTKNISAGSSDLIVSVVGCLGNTPSMTITGGNGNAMAWLRASVSGIPATISGQGWAGACLLNGRNPCTFDSLVTLVGDARIGAGSYSGSGADFVLDVASGNAIEGDYDLIFNAVWGPITVNDPIASGPGSVTKTGADMLTLDADNTYLGATVVSEGTLALKRSTCLEESTDVYLYTGVSCNLDFAGVQTINALYIDDALQANGTWGAAGSGATFTDPIFDAAGSGMLQAGTLTTTSTTTTTTAAVTTTTTTLGPNDADFQTWNGGDPLPGADWKMDNDEVGWIIEYWLGSGEYYVQPASPTGYAPGLGSHAGDPNNADFQTWNGGDPFPGADWVIDSDEVGWIIEYWLGTGEYCAEPLSPTGYAPVP